MNHNYIGQLEQVAESAAMAINNYDGDKVVILPSGEKAIDNDDAWILIGREEGAVVRDKREQRIRDTYRKEGLEYPEHESSDEVIINDWDYETICGFADILLGI